MHRNAISTFNFRDTRLYELPKTRTVRYTKIIFTVLFVQFYLGRYSYVQLVFYVIIQLLAATLSKDVFIHSASAGDSER